MLTLNSSDRGLTGHCNDSVTSVESSTLAVDFEKNDKEALFYIITVLMFYAVSIVTLMVKYLRQEKQEAEFTNYYYEFVSRDKFQDPLFQNSLNVRRTLNAVHDKNNKVAPTKDNVLYTKLAFSETSV